MLNPSNPINYYLSITNKSKSASSGTVINKGKIITMENFDIFYKL